jgi:hypothetical protein
VAVVVKSTVVIIVVEGIRRSFAKHEDAPEHRGCVTADDCLDHILDCLLICLLVCEVVVALANLDDETAVVAVCFPVITSDSQVVGVITAGTPSMAPGLIGLKHLAGYKLFMCALLTASGHQSRRSLVVNYQIDGSIEVSLHAVVALVRSQRCRSRSWSK